MSYFSCVFLGQVRLYKVQGSPARKGSAGVGSLQAWRTPPPSLFSLKKKKNFYSSMVARHFKELSIQYYRMDVEFVLIFILFLFLLWEELRGYGRCSQCIYNVISFLLFVQPRSTGNIFICLLSVHLVYLVHQCTKKYIFLCTHMHF